MSNNKLLQESIKKNLPTKAQDHRFFGNIPNGSSAYLIKYILESLSQFCICITKDSQQAFEIEQSLRFYKKYKDDILIFPDWETLPYDTL
ncbi:MAG: transcription-repair coupling factor (superfamily II helicase), partial [Oleiphilaceae bacterium]